MRFQNEYPVVFVFAETEEGFVVVFSKKESVEDDKHTDIKPTGRFNLYLPKAKFNS